MRISDWSSDVCSSDLAERDAADQSTQILIDVFGQALHAAFADHGAQPAQLPEPLRNTVVGSLVVVEPGDQPGQEQPDAGDRGPRPDPRAERIGVFKQMPRLRSEEHTSELQSLM